MFQKGYQLLIFTKAINRRVTKIPDYNECALSRHRPTTIEYLTLDLLINRQDLVIEVFMLGYKNFGLQWRRIKSPSAKGPRYLKLRIYLSTDKVFESSNSQTWLDFHYDIEFEDFHKPGYSNF